MAIKQLGKYEVLERLGRGGTAEVYKAYQASLDRYVAVKLLHPFLADDPEFKDRFEREARNVGRLRHNNIVQVYDFDFDAPSESYYMVMELIQGVTLKDRLEDLQARGERIPLDEVFRILIGACDALAYAHARGMIHRDVKPGNLMLDEDGRVILTDFGIAKIVTGIQFTASGGMVGTPAYMAPEQGLGEKGDERADLYSLGVILFQMLTGRLPYDAESPLAVILKHLNEPIPDLAALAPETPDVLVDLLYRVMAKDPDDRYQTADELLQAFRGAQEAIRAGAFQPIGARAGQAAPPGAGGAGGSRGPGGPGGPSGGAAAPESGQYAAEPRAPATRRLPGAFGGGGGIIVVVGLLILLGAAGFGTGIIPALFNPSATPTATTTPTLTATASASPTLQPTATNTATATATATSTATATLTPTLTPSLTPTLTATSTATASATPTLTPSATTSPTSTPSSTPTATFTNTPTPTPSPTLTATATSTATPSLTPSWTPTMTPTATASNTPTPTMTLTPSATLTPTPNLTATLAAATNMALVQTATAVAPTLDAIRRTQLALVTPTPNYTATALTCRPQYLLIVDKTPDKDPIKANTDFTRTITLRNTGDCDWLPGTSIQFNSGERFGASIKITMDNTDPVAPNNEATFTFKGRTPRKGGTYTGQWELRLAPDNKLVDPLLAITFFCYE